MNHSQSRRNSRSSPPQLLHVALALKVLARSDHITSRGLERWSPSDLPGTYDEGAELNAAAIVGTRSTRIKSILQLLIADWKGFCLAPSCKLRWDGTGQAKGEQ
jgi:hypothetical protein